MIIPRSIIFILFIFTVAASCAQPADTVFSRYAEKATRDRLTKNLTEKSIGINLRMPLADSTETYWQDGFYAMQLLRSKPAWALARLKMAWATASQRSEDFQRALLHVSYALYPGQFAAAAAALQQQTTACDIFGLCMAYQQLSTSLSPAAMQKAISKKFGPGASDTPVLKLLVQLSTPVQRGKAQQLLPLLLDTTFAPGSVVVYSLQRKNRNYPGIVIVRNGEGKLVRDTSGTVFSVPQLARSVNNLPACFSKGNTPQGIFRMFGFGRSRISFIGPTENLQLAMPLEMPALDFFDGSVTDSSWLPAYYESLLPPAGKNYAPLWQSYYASLAGRTEIIAHGTTVDPAYYTGTTYFPLTPTEGCLCTKEIWNTKGWRTDSDQQRLANAVKAAGGAKGYLVVLELDDKAAPVALKDILPYIKGR